MSQKLHFHGRSATLNPDGRYLDARREAVDDGWAAEEGVSPRTVVIEEVAKTLITRNDSPDLSFRQSINPYRGCEHGCIYCYARPWHAWIDLSPGLDFETRIFAKTNAAQVLRRELARPGYVPETIMLGGNTDAYQPVERKLRVTRSILEVLAECGHPVGLVTKSALVERDIDLLRRLAEQGATQVFVSLDTLDDELARRMDPRAAAPHRRLKILESLSAAGIPSGVLVAPVIPWLTDHEIERTLEAAYRAGARSAYYTILRLPHEVKELFADWLTTHYPDKRDHVLKLVTEMHGGELYRAEFGQRMRGTGQVAEMIRQRFRLACRRLGFNRETVGLNRAAFRPPAADGQLSLF